MCFVCTTNNNVCSNCSCGCSQSCGCGGSFNRCNVCGCSLFNILFGLNRQRCCYQTVNSGCGCNCGCNCTNGTVSNTQNSGCCGGAWTQNATSTVGGNDYYASQYGLNRSYSGCGCSASYNY
ncbi:MAG: hypothetical protein IJA89_04665 [Clostridia bacterium]|nr:hypothetical protein [Clostridiales bacterium]MBQ3506050.1 hypothetical protein [Clostridia bacterium]